MVARRAALLITIGFCATLAIYNVSSWSARLTFPGDTDSVEGTPVCEIIRLARGDDIYSPVAGEFHGAIYGPLYYLVGAALINRQNPSRFPLRLISLVGLAGVLLSSVSVAIRMFHRNAAAITVSLLVLSYGFVTELSTSARCDVVGLAISLAGFSVAHKFSGTYRVFLSAPLFALALLYKQQFIAAPLAVFAGLLLLRHFRDAVAFALTLCSCLITFGVALKFLFFPGLNWAGLVGNSAAIFDWNVILPSILFTALLIGAPFLLALESVRRSRDVLLGCYLVSSLLICSMLLGKAGAGSWYYLETFIVVSICIGSLTWEALHIESDQIEIAFLLFLTVVSGNVPWSKAPTRADVSSALTLQSFFAGNVRGRVFSVIPSAAMFAGADVPITDPYAFTQLQRFGKIPDGAFLRERPFSAIILDSDLKDMQAGTGALYFSPQSVALIRSRYKIAAQLTTPGPLLSGLGGSLYVWVPIESNADVPPPAN